MIINKVTFKRATQTYTFELRKSYIEALNLKIEHLATGHRNFELQNKQITRPNTPNTLISQSRKSIIGKHSYKLEFGSRSSKR